MNKSGALTTLLVILGTSLVWFPLWATVLFSLYLLVTESVLHFDYLMPAELFPVALVGGALLIWAAVRARARTRWIGWAVGIAAGSLVGGQALAVVTGLASGRIAPAGWPWALVLASLAAYTLALVAAGTGGLLLLRDLVRAGRMPAKSD